MAVWIDFQMVRRIINGLENGNAVGKFICYVGGGDCVAVENQFTIARIFHDIAVAEVDSLRIFAPWTELDFRNDGIFRLEMDLISFIFRLRDGPRDR